MEIHKCVIEGAIIPIKKFSSKKLEAGSMLAQQSYKKKRQGKRSIKQFDVNQSEAVNYIPSNIDIRRLESALLATIEADPSE